MIKAFSWSLGKSWLGIGDARLIGPHPAGQNTAAPCMAPFLLLASPTRARLALVQESGKGGTMSNTIPLEGERNRLLRQLLEHHTAELSSRKQNLRVLATESADIGEDSEASIVRESRGLGAAIASISSRTVQLIEDSLRRLQAGTYGRCSDCDSEIASARLRALPFADACRECQERRDQARGAFLVLV
jgi:RNA polymerase-binding transcription factor